MKCDLTEQFEENRERLRGVAYRMLGSLSEAEDAVQEAWLRLHRSDTASIDNLGGWLTTVVARVSLDMLRARKSRREEAIDAVTDHSAAPSAEQEALLADSVGAALLIVLETLAPDERLAFVLHDLFGMSFDEIAPIVGRNAATTRQLASRARRRVQGKSAVPQNELRRQRRIVDAFLTAVREGDFDGLVAVLHPDVVVRGATEVRGATKWAKGAIAFANAFRTARPAIAMVDGRIGVIATMHGKLWRALRFTFEGDVIATVDIIADPEPLRALDIAPGNIE